MCVTHEPNNETVAGEQLFQHRNVHCELQLKQPNFSF